MADAIERLSAREAEHIAHLDTMIEDQAARFGWDAEQQNAERVVLGRTAAISVNFRDFQALLEAARQPQVPAEDVERAAQQAAESLPTHLGRKTWWATLHEEEKELYRHIVRTALQVTEGDKVERVHLYLGDKTRCGEWLTPDKQRTVAVQDVTCAACLAAYAAALRSKQEGER